MDIKEKNTFNKTFFTIIPSSEKEDFSLLIQKIKKLKLQPFHFVYVTIPIESSHEFKKQILDSGIKIKEFEIRENIIRLEVA